MSYNNPSVSEKLDDALFYYYTPQRILKWGFRAKDRHSEQEFDTQEQAHRKYRAYIAANPGLSEVCSRLSRGSEICIDFDGTIYPGHPSDRWNEMEPPDPVCVQTIQQLHTAGHKITIFSCRSNLAVIQDNMVAQRMMELMEKYLRKYDIPYDEVHMSKPNYAVVIDDKACKFDGSWAEVRNDLQMPPAIFPKETKVDEDGREWKPNAND